MYLKERLNHPLIISIIRSYNDIRGINHPHLENTIRVAMNMIILLETLRRYKASFQIGRVQLMCSIFTNQTVEIIEDANCDTQLKE